MQLILKQINNDYEKQKHRIIKLEGLTLKDINKINSKKYKIIKIKNENYVINIAMYKDRDI